MTKTTTTRRTRKFTNKWWLRVGRLRRTQDGRLWICDHDGTRLFWRLAKQEWQNDPTMGR